MNLRCSVGRLVLASVKPLSLGTRGLLQKGNEMMLRQRKRCCPPGCHPSGLLSTCTGHLVLLTGEGGRRWVMAEMPTALPARCSADLSPSTMCMRRLWNPPHLAAELSQNLSVWGRSVQGSLQVFEAEVLTSCRIWPLSQALPLPKHNTPLCPCPTTTTTTHSPGPGTRQRPQVLTSLFPGCPTCLQTVLYVSNRERKFTLA